MATVYCTPADIQRYFVDAPQFAKKLILLGQDFVQVGSTDVWILHASGIVGDLYRDGKDLIGSIQTAIVDVDTANDWYYDTATDALYVQMVASTAPTDDGLRYESAPDTFANIMDRACESGSQMLESVLDNRFPRPIPPGKNTARTYDDIVIEGAARFGIISLIESTEPGHPLVEDQKEFLWGSADLENDEQSGLIGRLNSGKNRLSWEITPSDTGEIYAGTLNAATTGQLIDRIGRSSVLYEKLKVSIGTGGVITSGVANATVTYSVVDKSGNSVIDETLIDMDFQEMGVGLQARFTDGVYTANDFWFVEAEGSQSQTSTVSTVKLVR